MAGFLGAWSSVRRRALVTSAVFIAAAIVARRAEPDSYINQPLAALVKSAEVIVVGRAPKLTRARSGFDVAVDEILKGQARGRRIGILDWISASGSPFFYASERRGGLVGVFFLERRGEDWRPAGYPAFFPLSERERVKTLLAMLTDLKSFADDPRVYDDPDLVTYVGEAFATPSVHCDDSWNMSERLTAHWASSATAVALFREKQSWPIHIRYDAAFRPDVTILDEGHDAELASAIARDTQQASFANFNRVRRFDTLDVHCEARTDWPEIRSRLKAKDAVRYVRGRLRSARVPVVLSAIEALTAMHDGEAAGLVARLLRSRRAEIVTSAAQFLTAVADPASVEPLAAAIKRASYPESDPWARAAANTLSCALDSFNGMVALPDLRRLAALGSSGAISAVKRLELKSNAEAIGMSSPAPPSQCR